MAGRELTRAETDLHCFDRHAGFRRVRIPHHLPRFILLQPRIRKVDRLHLLSRRGGDIRGGSFFGDCSRVPDQLTSARRGASAGPQGESSARRRASPSELGCLFGPGHSTRHTPPCSARSRWTRPFSAISLSSPVLTGTKRGGNSGELYSITRCPRRFSISFSRARMSASIRSVSFVAASSVG